MVCGTCRWLDEGDHEGDVTCPSWISGWVPILCQERSGKRSRFLQTDDRSVWAHGPGGACGHSMDLSDTRHASSEERSRVET